MLSWLKRKPVAVAPAKLAPMPTACRQCGKGCGPQLRATCAAVIAERNERATIQRHMDDDAGRGHDGMYA
jgi:hypothetical protein